jgi:hypothetical protein
MGSKRSDKSLVKRCIPFNDEDEGVAPRWVFHGDILNGSRFSKGHVEMTGERFLSRKMSVFLQIEERRFMAQPHAQVRDRAD